MTRCANEKEWPESGHNWHPPQGLDNIRIETPRLIIRLYELADAEPMYAAVIDCKEYLSTWMDWVSLYTCEDAAREYIIKHRLGIKKLRETREIGLGIFEKDAGRFIGSAGFHGLMLDTASAEIGYWIHKDLGGRGYATESATALISHLLRPQAQGGLGLQRVRSFCSGDNLASRRVLEKTGMPLEGIQHNDYFVKGFGNVTDRVCFGVMHSEWDCETHTLKHGVSRGLTPITPIAPD